MRKRILIFIVALLMLEAAGAQGLSARVWAKTKAARLQFASLIISFSHDSLKSSDTLTIQIDIELDRGSVLLEEPDLGDLEDWLLLGSERSAGLLKKSGARLLRRTYRLAPLVIGEVRFPQLRALVRSPSSQRDRLLLVDSSVIEVRSLLGVGEASKELLPIKTVVGIEGGSQGVWPWLLLAAAVLVLVWIYRSYVVSSACGDREESIRAEDWVSKALEGLPGGDEINSSNKRFIYQQALGVYRQLLARDLELTITSLSRSELIELVSKSHLTGEHKLYFRVFFERCDEMRFSGREVSVEEARQVIKDCRSVAASLTLSGGAS
jgi:hypothetical protein